MDNSVYRGEDIRFLHHLEKGKLHIFPEDFSVYRIHKAGLWQSSSFNKRLLEGMVANLRYLDIFPSASQKWEKDFAVGYRLFLSGLWCNQNLSSMEYDLFIYALSLLKNKDKILFGETGDLSRKIIWKDKILLKIYKYCQKKLRKKEYIQ